jgi:radical SAM superfamily enzyme YgiQ (UPF0313 family)
MNRKILFVYPRFQRHADAHPELRQHVPMNEYLGSPSLGIASIAAATPAGWEVEFRDDRLEAADRPTDASVVALSFFTPAATRGMQLADYFRAQGKVVVAGGIFPTAMPDVVQPHVDAVVVGEGEAAWPQILEDAVRGELKPRYQAEIACLDNQPLPRVDLYIGQERAGLFEPDDYPLQLSRGCPMKCEACILPVSMTKHLRTFPDEHVFGQLDALMARGKRACLTEDTSWLPGAARRGLESLIDHVLETGQQMSISYVGISMPMILATPRRLLEKARAAGVDMFYLVGGFDPITRKAFTGKDDRALERAYKAIALCHELDIEPYTSFLIGNDADDLDTADRMLEFANTANIAKAEFAIATPYPGTPRWDQLVAEDRILTREWHLYNDANVVFKPAQMSPEQLLEAYIRLWKDFYATRMHLAALGQAERTIQF